MEAQREEATKPAFDSRERPSRPTPSFDSSLVSSIAVSRDATEDEIKKAYRTLAQTCHPDKHSSPALREVSANVTKEKKCAYC